MSRARTYSRSDRKSSFMKRCFNTLPRTSLFRIQVHQVDHNMEVGGVPATSHKFMEA